jgi:hypothetical protein
MSLRSALIQPCRDTLLHLQRELLAAHSVNTCSNILQAKTINE